MSGSIPNQCIERGITACPLLPSQNTETETRHALEIGKSFLIHLGVSLAFLFVLEVLHRALHLTSIPADFKAYIELTHKWMAFAIYIVFLGAVAYKFIVRMGRWIRND